MEESWDNALGYGFWCSKQCAATKMAAGIPPLGSKRATKGGEATGDIVLAQAALEKQRKTEEGGWSPLAVAGVVGASLLGIALMVVIIKKAKK